MKTKVFILLVLFAAMALQAQRGVRIGYIDMEYILENVEEYQEANTQLASRVQKWKVEIEQKKSEVDRMKKDLDAEKVLLTKELIEERQEEIDIMEKEMLEYQQDRFGPEGDLVIQKRVLVQPIQDQVFNAVQEIAAKRRYDFIFDKSADVVMLYSNKSYDISDLVLRSINRTRKQEERKGRNTPPGKSEKDKFEDATPNPAIQAREQEAETRRQEKAKTLEERRQKKLQEREELKKAYEERRQKLLDARAAKKKAAQEAREKKKKEKDQKDENGSDENDNNLK